MDDLRRLLNEVQTLTSVRDGNRDPALFRQVNRIGDGSQYLFVLKPYTQYGLSEAEAKQMWEATETVADQIAFEQEVAAFWAEQGIDPRPKPTPEPIVTKWDEPAPEKPKPSIIRRVLRR